MTYTRTCESCGKYLVEVDNPYRREIRHRRGEEVQCPAWREAAGLPALTQGAPSGANPDARRRDIGPGTTS